MTMLSTGRGQAAILGGLAATALIVWGGAWLATSGDGAPAAEDTTPTQETTIGPTDPGETDGQVEITPPLDLNPPTIDPGQGQLRPSLPSPAPTASARAIAKACAIRTFTYDTKVDTSRRDAAARCSPYASEAYAAALSDGAIRTDAEWESWVDAGVYTTVDAAPIPSPGQDVVDDRLISWRLTITTHDRSGATNTLEPVDVAVRTASDGDTSTVEGLIFL